MLFTIVFGNGKADIQLVVRIMLKLPSARAEVTRELAKTRVDLQQKIAPKVYPPGVDLADSRAIPEHGHDIEWLRNQWTNLHKLERGDLESGRVSGAVYHVWRRRRDKLTARAART